MRWSKVDNWLLNDSWEVADMTKRQGFLILGKNAEKLTINKG